MTNAPAQSPRAICELTQRGLRQRAFVLHSRPWSETSLLECSHGKNRGACALSPKRWARDSTFHPKGALQPFTPLLLRYSGRARAGEVKTLRKAPRQFPLALPLSGITLYSGLYINEPSRVLNMKTRFLRTLFLSELYSGAGGNHRLPEPALRRFELALLGHLGYGVNFTHCVQAAANGG